MFKSVDSGVTWSETGLKDIGVSALAIDPFRTNILYAGTRSGGTYGAPEIFKGLFKSTDSGSTWSAINNGLTELIDTHSTIADLVIDPQNSSILYAGTFGSGVFKSIDGGASWIQFNDGLTSPDVRSLAPGISAGGGNILYATTSGGIFKLVDVVPESRNFFVPMVLSSAGVGGAFYTSELTLANRSAQGATIEFTYTAAFGGGSGGATDFLEAGRQRTVPDAIAYLRQLGIPIPESGSRGGTLQVRFSGLSSPYEAAVIVRTTTTVPEGRAGLVYPGVPSDFLLDDPAFLVGLRQDATYRTNLALQNAGETGDITLRMRVFSGNPAVPFFRDLPDIVLPPGGFHQVNEILRSHGLLLSSGYVRVERVSGSAPFYAYAVIHNQTSSDGSYVPPISGSSSRLTLPLVPGRESKLRSELVLTNSSSVDKKVSLSFQALDTETFEIFPVEEEITLKANEQMMLPDAVAWLMEISSRHYQTGPLIATVEGQNAEGVFVGLQISGLAKGGQYGLFFPPVPAEQESRSPTWLFGLQQNTENRSNVAIVNLGTETIGFTVELYDGETGIQAGKVQDLTVSARGWVQLNALLANYAVGVTQGYARVVPTGLSSGL